MSGGLGGDNCNAAGAPEAKPVLAGGSGLISKKAHRDLHTHCSGTKQHRY